MLITHVVYARGGKGGLWNNSSDPTTFRDLFQVEEEKKHLSHATIDVREIANSLCHNSHCLIIFTPLLTKQKKL
jgi:hypothetical protein